MNEETRHHLLRLKAMQRDCAAKFNGTQESAALLMAIKVIEDYDRFANARVEIRYPDGRIER